MIWCDIVEFKKIPKLYPSWFFGKKEEKVVPDFQNL